MLIISLPPSIPLFPMSSFLHSSHSPPPSLSPLRRPLFLPLPLPSPFIQVTLSAAMEQAITAPRVEEEEELGAMLAAARGLGESTEEDGDLATKRFVSDEEWQLLQQEVL